MPVSTEAVLKIAVEVDKETGEVRLKQLGDAGEKAAKKTDEEFKKSGRTLDDYNRKVRNLQDAWLKYTFIVGTVIAVLTTLTLTVNKTIAAASNLQEVTSKFETVFGKQSDQAYKWAKALEQSYAMSTREARQYLASLQDLLKPMGVAAQTAAKLSFEIVKLAADLGSFNNLPTAQVIADIQSALVGNYETMKKYGVVINAALVGQKAMAMHLAATKDALTAAHKAQAAYELIVAGSTDAIGDMNRTMDGYANQSKAADAALENLSATIGDFFMPQATEMQRGITAAADALSRFLKNLKDVQKQAREGGRPLFGIIPTTGHYEFIGPEEPGYGSYYREQDLPFAGFGDEQLRALEEKLQAINERLQAAGAASGGDINKKLRDLLVKRKEDELKLEIEYSEKITKLRLATEKKANDLFIKVARQRWEDWAGEYGEVLEGMERGDKEAAEARIREQEKANRAVKKSYDNLIEGMQSTTYNFLDDLRTGTISSWKDALDEALNLFLKWAEAIAARQIVLNIGAPALNAFGITSTSGGNFLFNAAGSAAGNVATSSGASALASLLSSSSTGLPYGAAVGEFGAVSGGLAGVAGPLAAAAPYALGAAAIAGLAYLIASSQTHANYGTIGPSTGTIAGGALGFTPFDITPPGTYGVKHQDAEASQRLAESVNQGAQAITDAFNEQMVQLIPLLGDNFVDSIEGTVIEFAAKYNSGFEGFSISDQGDFQTDLENILIHISSQLWAAVIPMVEQGASKAIADFRSSAAGSRMGQMFIEAGDFVAGGRGNFASDEEYINAVRDFLTLQQNAVAAWDDINAGIDKQLGLLTPYEQQLADVNTQFDTWIATLEALGYSAEALATIEGRRTDVLDKLAEDEAARQAAAAAKTAAQRVKELANEIENLQQAAAAAAQPYEALRGSIQPYLIGQARRDWQASDYAYRYQELEAAFGALDPSAADYRDESIRIMEEQYEVLQAIEQLNQEQVQQTGALIGSLSDTIDRIIGGDLAAYQSPGWYGQRYASLLSSARGGDQAAAEAFNQFVPQYLEFMGAYGGNYSQLSSAVLQDLEGLKNFYEGQQDLATNEMLLQTTISTNSLLEALLHKADEQIAAIHQQAAAETAAKQAALDAANNAAVAQYIASLSSAEKAQINAEAYVNRYSDLSKAYYETYYPGDIVYWAQKHWADFGQAERRTYGADLEAYARSILGLQHGGTAYAGVPYWVGEMGMPEVIIPNQTSTVVSNNTIRQAFDPEAIGDAVARAVMPAIAAVSRAGGEVHVHLNSREIAYAFAEEIPRNGDLQYAISRVPARRG